MTYTISVIPGDGIGPEVMAEILPLIDWLSDTVDLSIEFNKLDWGSERYLRTGQMMPDDGVHRLAESDAILLGAVGHPEVPDHITLQGLLLPIRKGFNQVVCKRPSRLYQGVESPLWGYEADEIDFVVYRENTEGEYADVGGRVHRGFDHEVAIQSSIYTRRGTEVIVRCAFEAATRRDGKVTSVTKSNAQAHGMVFWDEVVEDVRKEYPKVDVESLLVDAACMDLIRRPDEFDVIVTSNLFGDILTDIGATVTGGIGLVPTGNIDPTGDHPSMFEPIHGSAPDIAGQNVANPIGTILSASMMFEELGEDKVADRISSAVETLLSDTNAPRTPDIGGDAQTEEVVASIRNYIDRV